MPSSPPLPTDRKLGLTLGIACLVLAAWLQWRHRGPITWLAIAGSLLLAFAWLAPHVLRPVNVAWMKLGWALNAVVSPLVLGIVFFGLITPIAWAMRTRGRDVLRLRLAGGDSYWIAREPPGPDAPRSFPLQF